MTTLGCFARDTGVRGSGRGAGVFHRVRRVGGMVVPAAAIPTGCEGSAPPEDQASAAASSPADPPGADDLRRALREYVTAQEAHFAEHAFYAHDKYSIRPYLDDSDDVIRTMVAWTPSGHSAVVRLRDRLDLVCGVAIGDAAPPLLDGAADGEVTCRTAVRGPVPVSAPSGLLLGSVVDVRRPDNPVPRFVAQTRWIVFDGDSSELVTNGPGLVAPRDDGFWRFEVGEDQRGTGVLIAEAASRPGRRDTVASWRDWLDPSNYQSLTLTIEFVGPRHVGYRKTSRDLDDPNFEYTASSGVYGTVGPSLEALQPEDLLGQPLSARMLVSEEDDPCRANQSWTIVREPGRWVFGEYHNSGVRICGFSGSSQPGVLPSSDLVGYPPVALDLVHLVVPEARDAVVSPGGDAIVALTRDSIYAFTASPTAFGPAHAVAAAPICERLAPEEDPAETTRCYPARIVMTEWALGRHVRRWTREVGALLKESSAEGAR